MLLAKGRAEELWMTAAITVLVLSHDVLNWMIAVQLLPVALMGPAAGACSLGIIRISSR